MQTLKNVRPWLGFKSTICVLRIMRPTLPSSRLYVEVHPQQCVKRFRKPNYIFQASRLLPSLVVTLFVGGACYIFAETYQPPTRAERMWRDTPPAAATMISLIGANALIFVLWRGFPPAWRMLNRYFISVPLYPYSLSMVGSVFSHQQLRHLATNMFILWFMGTRREF